MRETIDFGIDLGTTNSAIAVADDDGVRIIKNNDGWDCTPSAVWSPRPGVIHVGRRARERTESDVDDAYAEFKQEMGVAGAHRRFRRAGITMSPEELSAEVLKSLRQDVAHECGYQPEAAVITVPASFALNQNNATSEAAALAGLGEHCPLVQEPTAAAIAYGVQDASDSAHWMVFDLGGGTFDAAVMSKRDGELQLIQHAGDPYLGGKLIDWALVDDLLAPAVQRDLGLAEFTRRNPRWGRNFAKLKLEAENAKIALSRTPEVDLFVDLDDGEGNPQPFEFTLTRGALDDLALPFYVRAIRLCRDALAESALRPDHIDRMLLVGGATLSPGLRELLADPKEGLGIALDHSQDPTTVVARGAAVFASSVRLPRKPHRAAVGEFAVELTYPPQTVDTTGVPVSGKVTSGSDVDWSRYAVTLANPEGQPPFWGPRIELTADGAFYTEVSIDANAKSRFVVELTDAAGTRQKLTGDTFSITHTAVVPGDAVLTGTLGIGKADGRFDPLLRKGTSLPTMVTKTYRTTIALRRSEPDAVIKIPLLEGERRRADRNTRVGLLEIRPRDVRIELPAQSEVEVTFEIQASSREVLVTADIPLVQQQFEATINRSDLLAPEHDELVDRLHDLEARVGVLRDQADDVHAEQAQRALEDLGEQRAVPQLRKEVDAAAVDTGAAVTSDRRIRDLEAQLDDIEESIEVPGLQRELWELLGVCQDIIEQTGGGHSDRAELQTLRDRASTLGDDATPADLRRLIERASEFQVELLRRTDQWDFLVFSSLESMRDQMSSRSQADAAILEGRQAIASGNRRALAGVNERLRRLLPPGAGGQIEHKPGGII
ncbi:Hsp70 family protein [Streptomyces sp. 3MP-14]|uniref:Hsp70 family protein n=1 Tax=Streptomyces mimosae TaxID=2586635 RepID=A0A5N5ZLS5_9ACTN|nr:MULTISPECIES: Hsp70 family protein [Streptomyces]KAB8157447.1 Hsp70 family protein [Streptomyces mimosae]KAB8172271.1 Hsp70 family protein [Streptomyces sp. 3MP-14]